MAIAINYENANTMEYDFEKVFDNYTIRFNWVAEEKLNDSVIIPRYTERE